MIRPLRAAKNRVCPFRQFTDFYVKAFFEDIKALNIEPADVYPKATDHIPEMVAINQNADGKRLSPTKAKTAQSTSPSASSLTMAKCPESKLTN